ncbi:hypothetical protein JY97_12965 [Alkalispirochaeta odontotermitis]|nr:hypothetical protein JY97_12965 [Alkalispirochaeta odontotermitis]
MFATGFISCYWILDGETGKYDRLSAAHAWNSNFLLTNVILLHLPRHSDYHIHPNQGYQVLRHLDESPQMPTGYAGMFVLALVPRLWFKIMDPIVLAYHQAKEPEFAKITFN